MIIACINNLPSPRCRFVLGIFRVALCSEMECNHTSSCSNILTMHAYDLFYRNTLWVQQCLARPDVCMRMRIWHAHQILCSPLALEVTAPEWRLLQGLNIYVCMYTALLLFILGEFQMNENCIERFACALRCISVYDVTAWSARAVIPFCGRTRRQCAQFYSN